MALLAIVIVLVSVAETKNIAFATETGSESEEFTSGNTENNEDAGSDEEASEETKEEASEETKEEASEETKKEATEETKEEASEETKKEATEETKEEATEETQEESAPEEAAAAEENEEVVVPAPVEPTKPQIEGEVNNDKINQYNSDVDTYNQQVDEYNQAVDAEYEAEVQNVQNKNDEIDKHNAEEDRKVQEAEQQNEANKEQYQKDLKQYNYDLYVEKYLSNYGYASTAEYNQWVKDWQHTPYVESQKVTDDEVFDLAKTYEIISAEEKSGIECNVYFTHNFLGYKVFEETLKMDANDIIWTFGAGKELNTVQPGYCCFYMKSDDNHVIGYWSQAYGYISNAAIYKDGVDEDYWFNGSAHYTSFKDGTKYASDTTDTYVEYLYVWNPVSMAKTYHEPEEPVLVEVKYDPEYLTKLDMPTKKAYLSYLGYMDLLPEPEETVEPEPAEEEPVIPVAPEVTPAPVEPAAPETPAAPAEPAANDEPYVAPAPVVIAEAPVALAEVPAPEAQVLGATREEAPAAVLGARRGSTEDTNNSMARIIFIIIAGAAVITVLFTRRTKA